MTVPRDWKVILWVEQPSLNRFKGAVAVVPAWVRNDARFEHKTVTDARKKLKQVLWRKGIKDYEIIAEIWKEK